MINIINKIDCVGCSACVQKCPKQCIAFKSDNEGFLYPSVDVDRCINCGLCERVCPVINQNKARIPLKCLAARSISSDDLLNSSSGGIFGIIARHILNNNGTIFGAAFSSDMTVEHRSIDKLSDLHLIQRSKYSQSRIGLTYLEAENLLKSGKFVLFSGTPCQIAGLHLFLRKEYPNLLTIDVACHSVPSPKVWRAYLNSKSNIKFNGVNFRDKKEGWLKYGFSLYYNCKEVFYERSSQNPFMKGFLKDLYSRPSCSKCPAKGGRSGSDLTLADFWGIWDVLPDFDSHNGVSAVLLNTLKGQKIYEEIISCTESKTVKYEDVIRYNSALINSAIFPKQRNDFWNRFNHEGIECVRSITDSMQPSFIRRAINFSLRKLGLK